MAYKPAMLLRQLPLPDPEVAVPVQTMSLPTQEGAVDGVVNGTIRGWVLARRPGNPSLGGVRLLVTCDGIEIAVIQAIEPRNDVAAALGCESACGFSFVLPAPYRIGRPHAFRLLALPDRVELAHSPVHYQAPGCAADGEVARLQATVAALTAQLRTLQADARPAGRAEDVPLDRYADWAVGYFPALRARIRRARLSHPGWLSGQTGQTGAGPRVSVVLPLFRTRSAGLEAAVRSVLNQSYENWELILVDDASASRGVSARIEALCRQDTRIRAVVRPVHGGIGAATNDAVDIATGELVAFLGQEDALVDVALEAMVNAMAADGHDAAYSDEDVIDAEGQLALPWLKPDFNPRLLLAQECVGRLLMVRRPALNAVWPLEPDYDGVQDHALTLRLAEALGDAGIHHVAEILYHRRGPAMATLSSGAAAEGKACIAAHLRRRGLRASVHAVPGTARFEVEWKSGRVPAVSVIVTGGLRGPDLVAFATALHGRTRYRRMKVLLAGHCLGLGECGDALHQAPAAIRMLELAAPPSHAALLNAAAAAGRTGDYLLFLHDAGFPRSADWLRLLLAEAEADDRVAVVGCKHIGSDGTVWGGATVLGVDGPAAPMHSCLNAADPGYMGRAACAQDVSAVSLDILLCRADAFGAVGGFDEGDMPDSLLAVDLCLRLRAGGYRTVWIPAMLIDHGGPDEALVVAELPRKGLGAPDPAYNVNFTRWGGTFKALNGARLDASGNGG